MAQAVLSAADAKARSLALRVGQRIEVVWRLENDTNILTWKGTVRETKADWVVVNYDQASDPTEPYDLPYQRPGIEYLKIGPEADPTSAGNMVAAARARMNLFNITEWRPTTWGHLLHPTSGDRQTSRAQLMNELKTFFFLKTRHELNAGSDSLEQELATAYESLLAWTTFAQQCAEWKSPVILGLIEPLIIRLCALRRASPYKDEKRRNENIQAVYRAWTSSTPTRDKLSELMNEPLGRSN